MHLISGSRRYGITVLKHRCQSQGAQLIPGSNSVVLHVASKADVRDRDQRVEWLLRKPQYSVIVV